MDGVLANFVKSALEIHGYDIKDVLQRWPAGEWEISHILGISTTLFWNKVDTTPEFWPSLEEYEWSQDLFKVCQKYGEVFICSTPSRHPNSSAGKVCWLQKWAGSRFRDYILTEHKYLLAGPDRILIDDSDTNIFKFKEHGGHGILFPQIWNSLHYYGGCKIESVKYHLESIKVLK